MPLFLEYLPGIEDVAGIEEALDLLLDSDVFRRKFQGQQVPFETADAVLP